MAFALRTLALRALLVPALLLGGAAGAHAASIVVDYDLDGTTLDISDPMDIEVGAEDLSGFMQITFAADEFGNILLDGASAVTFESLQIDIALSIMGLVTGPVGIDLLAPVEGGTLSSGGIVSFAGAPDASLWMNGTLNCSLVCGVVGLDNGTNVVDTLIDQPLGDLDLGAGFDPAALHELSATLNVAATLSEGSLGGTVNLVATETGRTFIPDPVSVPEPGTALLLGSGLVGLVAFGRRPRREGTSIRQG